MKRFIRSLLFLMSLVMFTGCNSDSGTEETKQQPSGGSTMSNPIIKFETSKGNFTAELYADKAPKSVENFLSYVNAGFYDGTIYHRVIAGFMIQGGGMNPDMSEKSNNAPIENEADNGLKNDEYTLAMARTNDPHSATSQFFINAKNNDFLNHSAKTAQGWGYAVFGKVTEGMDIVKTIEAVKTGNHGQHGDVPLDAVVINKVTVVK
jgi:peptidyl-prolyl cis-trans isomerase B (cyclophilin B)